MANNPEPSLAELLFNAVRSGDLKELNLLVDQGADVNATYMCNDTPLHFAIQKGHKLVVQFLIAHGAKIDALGLDGSTPLNLAAQLGRKDIAEILIANSSNIRAIDLQGRSPLHWAVYRGHWDVVDVLRCNGGLSGTRFESLLAAVLDDDERAFCVALGLKDGEAPNCQAETTIFTPDEAGAILPHFASSHSSNVMDYLLTFFCCDELINAVDKGGWTPLHIATSSGAEEIAARLLNSGANLNAKDCEGCTPLHIAAWGNRLQIAEMLLMHCADVNARSLIGETPLLIASSRTKEISFKSKEMIELLISWGADVNAANRFGVTALHRVALQRADEIYDILIEAGGDDSRPSKYGGVPLHMHEPFTNRQDAWLSSIQKGRINKVRALAERGVADVLDENGSMPIHYAAGYGNRKIIEFLLSCGADVNAKNSLGATPLHFAMQQDCAHPNFDVVRILLKNSANINAANNSDQTPLDIAVEIGGVEEANFVELLIRRGARIKPNSFSLCTTIEELLLDNGADVMARLGTNGSTALHIAVNKDHTDLVKLLVSRGADLEARDESGKTPLFASVQRGNADIARVLLARGADANATDKMGMTPLDKANSFVSDWSRETANRARLRIVLVACGALTAEKLLTK